MLSALVVDFVFLIVERHSNDVATFFTLSGFMVLRLKKSEANCLARFSLICLATDDTGSNKEHRSIAALIRKVADLQALCPLCSCARRCNIIFCKDLLVVKFLQKYGMRLK